MSAPREDYADAIKNFEDGAASRDAEVAELKAQVIQQQARIAQMRIDANRWEVIKHLSTVSIESMNKTEKATWKRLSIGGWYTGDLEALLDSLSDPLATTDDLSALKAHDDALWNEALTTGIEWQATRGHTLDADDYEHELRGLKR